MSAGRRFAAGFALAGAIAAPAYRARALSGDGALAALVVGTSTFGRGGLRPAIALITFFVSSSILSRLPGGLPREAESSRRNARQVLANGGIAALVLSGWPSARGRAAAIGAIAAATADTWATETGTRWGGRPRPIWGRRAIDRGDSGGVTAAGTAGGLAGAALIAAIAGLPSTRSTLATTLAGTAGMLADSVLGATIQARFACAVCAEATERRLHCSRPARRMSGAGPIDNDAVNAIGSAVGALIGLLLAPHSRAIGRLPEHLATHY